MLAGSPWKSLEVAHDGAGKPSMIVNGQPAAGTLSVSHSGEIAVAVFVALEPRQIIPAPAPPQSVPAATLEAPKSSRTPSVISLLALLISIAALLFTFLHR
jgi:hypothetical protein